MKDRNIGFTLIELLTVMAIVAILAALLFPVFASMRRRANQTTCISQEIQVAMAVNLYSQDVDDCFPTLNTSFSAENAFPGRTRYFSWMLSTFPYATSAQIYMCPEAKNRKRVFAFTASGKNLDLPERHVGINNYLCPDATAAGYLGPIMSSTLGAPTLLPLIADSVYVDFDNPDYIIVSDYDTPALDSNSAAFESDSNLPLDRVDPSFARHNGGANIVFADSHSKWMSQRAMGPDASRAGKPFPQSFLLPVDTKDDRVQ